MNITLPKGTRARIRRQVDSPQEAAGRGQKRRPPKSGGLEGVIRGQKRGRYVLELPDGAGARHVLLEHLQPLLTQKQAERLLDLTATPGAAASSEAGLSNAASSV